MESFFMSFFLSFCVFLTLFCFLRYSVLPSLGSSWCATCLSILPVRCKLCWGHQTGGRALSSTTGEKCGVQKYIYISVPLLCETFSILFESLCVISDPPSRNISKTHLFNVLATLERRPVESQNDSLCCLCLCLFNIHYWCPGDILTGFNMKVVPMSL